MKTRAITEGALMAALSVVSAVLSYYVPLFSVVSYFLLPLPTVVCYKRWGLATAAVESVAASILLLFFMGPLNALIMAADIILPGLLLGYAYEKNLDGGRRFVLGYAAFLLTLSFELMLAQVLTGTSVTEDFINEINNSTEQIVQVYQSSGLLENESGQALLANIEGIKDALKMLLPTVILILPALISYTTVLLYDVFFRRFKLSYSPMPPITDWTFTRSAKDFMSILMLTSIIASRVLRDNPALYIYPFTAEMLGFFIAFIMGFSTFCWLIQFRFKRKLVFLRVLLLLMCVMFTPCATFLVIIGIIDIFFDLKGILRNWLSR